MQNPVLLCDGSWGIFKPGDITACSILLGTNVLLSDDMVRHLPCLVTSQQHPTVPLCDDTMILCETLVMLGDIYSSILLGTTVPLCDGTGYRETLVMLGDIESSIPS